MSSDASARESLVEMLRRAGAGEREALRAVYDATQSKLFGICLRILNDRAEAEDVLQSVYLTIWQRAASFDADRASPITWLATIARNRSIDRLRARPAGAHVDIETAFDVADPAPPATDMLEMGDEARRLGDCIGELGERQAMAVRAAFFEGLTYEALAVRESVPLGTMKSWIRRALHQLRGCLER